MAKQGQGFALDPPKAGGLWKPIYFQIFKVRGLGPSREGTLGTWWVPAVRLRAATATPWPCLAIGHSKPWLVLAVVPVGSACGRRAGRIVMRGCRGGAGTLLVLAAQQVGTQGGGLACRARRLVGLGALGQLRRGGGRAGSRRLVHGSHSNEQPTGWRQAGMPCKSGLGLAPLGACAAWGLHGAERAANHPPYGLAASLRRPALH